MTYAFALSVSGLTKSFHGKLAVDQATISVRRGEIVGFLGPNGAGKTTVMNMATGLIRPDGGSIELLGVMGGSSRKDTLARIGFLQEKPRIYPDMSARAYLTFFARLYGIAAPRKRVGEALERVGLTGAADKRLGAHSRGMQQRACLARVMLHRPEFLILDEPTLGLDPNGVAEMRAIFLELREAGATILFSSHHLAEIERLCDSVVLMNAGRVVAAGQQRELVPADFAHGRIAVELLEPAAAHLPSVLALPCVAEARDAGGGRLEIVPADSSARDERHARGELARALAGLGLTVLSVEATAPTLEDLFLSFTHEASSRAPSKRAAIGNETLGLIA